MCFWVENDLKWKTLPDFFSRCPFSLFFRASGEDVRLMLWDTAGQEEFDAITKAYYRGAQACVIAFSTTDHASFEAVKKWKRKVEDECGHVPMVLVQNKIDLLHESQVDRYRIHFQFRIELLLESPVDR